jgi:hypothetical protein
VTRRGFKGRPREHTHLVVDARDGGFLHVMKGHFEVHDALGRHAQLVGEHLDQQRLLPILPGVRRALVGGATTGVGIRHLRRACRRRRLAIACGLRLFVGWALRLLLALLCAVESLQRLGSQNRLQVIFLVHLERLALLWRLQVDAQGRHPKDWAINAHKALLDAAAALAAHHDPARYRKVAIKPRVPKAAAVTLDLQLQAAGGLALGPRFDSQIWRVCMCANHLESATWLVTAAHCKGDEA